MPISYVEPHEAMEACADRLDILAADDDARPEILAIYVAAAHLQSARQTHPGGQVDARMPVPAWLLGGTVG